MAVTLAKLVADQTRRSTAPAVKVPRQARLAITTGEPAGVGPELMYFLTNTAPLELPLTVPMPTAELALCAGIASFIPEEVELVLIGSKQLLQERMGLWHQPFCLTDFDPEHFQPSGPGFSSDGCGRVSVLDIPLPVPSIPGHMDAENSRYVKAILDQAISLCQSGICQGIVTAPISKSIMVAGGLEHFTGHTEYLQEQTSTHEVVMMLGCSKMNVALVTTHLPIAELSAAITPEKLTDIITVLNRDLKERFNYRNPAIFVCGLNPHAGESGTLGREELDTIIPTLEKLKASSRPAMDLRGPLPADTIFQPKYLKEAAAILAMYHDQGLPVLKYAGFDEGYNTTLGLPFIRTSVDHGTALDLAGKCQADPVSLQCATALALYQHACSCAFKSHQQTAARS